MIQGSGCGRKKMVRKKASRRRAKKTEEGDKYHMWGRRRNGLTDSFILAVYMQFLVAANTHHRYEWNAIPWRKLEVKVFKLQRRIYQATTRGETKKAHRLQKLLASSWSAKSLAVRRVTQENTGKKTAGVDGASNLTPPQRLKLISTMNLHAPVNPVRRIWIPKPGKPEKRPLGIPIMHDRGTQALAKMALEPEWEAKFEPNSFGFRPGRSCQDAIRQIYNVINLQPRYVLDADIASCFDPAC